MESKVEHYLNPNIPPAVCYPIGDRVVFCLNNLDATMEYQLHKQLLKGVEGIVFENRILKIQTKMGSYTFVAYRKKNWDTESFRAYQLSPEVTKKASIEELLEIRRIGEMLIQHHLSYEVHPYQSEEDVDTYSLKVAKKLKEIDKPLIAYAKARRENRKTLF